MKRIAIYLKGLDIPIWLGYLGIALIVTFPLILRFHTHILGDAETTDLLGHLWHCWWFKTALFQGNNPYYVPLVLYPIGSGDLLIKSGACLNVLFTLPFQVIFNLITSHNIVALFLMTLSAYGAYRLIAYLTKDKIAAFISGVIFSFNPLIFQEMSGGRMDQASIGWIPFFILFLFKTLREERMRNPLLAALFLALATFSYMGYGLFLSIFAVIFVLYYLIIEKERFDRAGMKRFVILVLVFCVMISPLVSSFIIHSYRNTSSELFSKKLPTEERQGSLKSFSLTESIIIHNSVNPFCLITFHGSGKGPGAFRLPYLITALAILGLFSRKAQSRFWLFSALFFLLLSWGPYLKLPAGLHFGGQGNLIPLPGLFFYRFLPFSSRLRFPYRFWVMFWLSLTVLAGLGLHRIFNLGIKKKIHRLLFSGLVIGLLFLEIPLRSLFPLPIPLSELPKVPDFYSRIAEEKEGAIIGIPIATGKPTMVEELAMPKSFCHFYHHYYQIVHHKPSLAGLEVSHHCPQAYKNFLDHHTLLHNLTRWQKYPSSLDFPPISSLDLRVLKELDFKYIIVHNDWLKLESAEAINHYLAQLFGEPERYPADKLHVYNIQGKGPAIEESAGKDNIYLKPWKYEESLRGYQAKLKSHPANPETLNNLGLLYMQYGRFMEATAVFEQARNFHPRSTSAWFNLGNSYAEQGLYEKAGLAYQRILKINLHYKEAKRELEISKKREYLSGNPHDVAVRQALASLYRKKEAYNQAIQELEKSLDIEPLNALTHLFLSQNYEAKGLLHKARKEYEKALDLDPELVPAREGLERLKKSKGRGQLGNLHQMI